MRLTEREFDRLPALLREIVLVDREVEAIAAEPDGRWSERFRAARARLKDLRGQAAQRWGHRLDGASGPGSAGALSA